MTEWQPIETAPKDGTYILVSIPLSLKSKVRIVNYNDHFWRDDNRNITNEPSHWMPLPRPAK